MDPLKFTVDQSPVLHATSYDALGDPENAGPYAWHVDSQDFMHFIKDNGDGLGTDTVTSGDVKVKFTKPGSTATLSVTDAAGNVDGGTISATAGKPTSVKITA